MAANAKTNSKRTNTARNTSSAKSKKSGSKAAKQAIKRRNMLIGDISLVVAFGFTVILYLANFGLCGSVGKLLINLTFGLFGIMGYITPIVVLLAVCFIISNKNKGNILTKLLLIFCIIIITGSFFCLFSIKEFTTDISWKTLYDISITGKIGGILGNAPILFLYPKFGKVATFIILLIVWIVLFLVVTDFSVIDWIEYRLEYYKENSEQVKEIREIKHQTVENRRKNKIEQQRLKNQEKMLHAMEDLEKSRQEKAMALKDESYQRLGRTSQKQEKVVKSEANTEEISARTRVVIPEEAVKAAVSTEGPKERIEVLNPIKGEIPDNLRKKRKDSDNERQRIPSFLLSDEEFDKKNKSRKNTASEEESLEESSQSKDKATEANDLLNDLFALKDQKKTVTNEEPSNEAATDFVMVPSTDFEETIIKPARKKDTLTRKPFAKVEEEDERIIEFAGGVMKTSVGMGGVKAVEAEGREKDPHGTGHEYEMDDDEKLVMELEKSVADNTQTEKKLPEKKYVFPPLSLLKKGSGEVSNNREQLKDTAERLQEVLKSFGVGARVTDVTCGPSVTRYELTPDTGVKVSKIVGLQDDIKLNLAAADIRIEAPIPGKAAVGIEVPNKTKTGVTIREMLESPDFKNHKSKLAFTAGKDIGGANVIGDISKMTHILIAGTTGSGKSVCVNTIIVSLLYHASPSEVKLLMIDPKVVELKIYNGIPHLLRPVITDPKQATGALNWAVSEMNRRYKLFAESNVRDLNGYNDKVKEQAIYGDIGGLKPLPKIVIIVDELADLMMTAPAEVEDSIQHLAQMARAAGMHLILITQRPTVNVVTGTIKGNIPSRIALAVASGTDSRTMIDMVGAEKLLGNGDMLYFPSGMTKPVRLQGPYVSDEEINSIVDFLKNQGNVEGGGVDESVNKEIEASQMAKEIAEAKQEDDGTDELLKEAGRFIIENDKASIGMLQRKFRIGFNRAARIMDTLAEMGVVGPEEGTKPRTIIMNIVQFDSLFKK